MTTERLLAVIAIAVPVIVTIVVFTVRWKWNKEWCREEQRQKVEKLEGVVAELKEVAEE